MSTPKLKQSESTMYTPDQYIELKHCPFCGGEAHMSGDQIDYKIRGHRNKFAFVSCHKCGVEGPVKYGASCRKTAATAWNKRVKVVS